MFVYSSWKETGKDCMGSSSPLFALLGCSLADVFGQDHLILEHWKVICFLRSCWGELVG